MPERPPNRGVLFKNDRRMQDTHAQAKGTAEIQCPCCEQVSEYYVDAWTNEKNGNKYQSLKFKAKEKRQGAPLPKETTKPAPKPPKDPDLDDEEEDFPF